MKNIETRLIVGSLKLIKYGILLVWCLTIIFVLWYYKVFDGLLFLSESPLVDELFENKFNQIDIYQLNEILKGISVPSNSPHSPPWTPTPETIRTSD